MVDTRPIVTAVFQRKGGVGKTTGTANVSHGVARILAQSGAMNGSGHAPVLNIDSDSQKNLTTYIGTEERKSTPGAMTINEAYRAPKKYSLEAIAPSTAAGVDLLYGSAFLEETEKELLTGQHTSAGMVMRRIIDRIASERQYKYIFIDCPPSEGLLVRNAIVAADLVIVPIQTDYAAFEGLGRLKDLLLKLLAEEAYEQAPPVYAFANFVDERVPRSRELRDFLLSDEFTTDNNTSDEIRVQALESFVHGNSAIADSYAEHKTIFEFAKTDKRGRDIVDKGLQRARDEFASLAQEILSVGRR